MNNDSKINCIDYSLLFRKIYGKDATLVLNTKMNHMLVKVNNIYVEPQGSNDTWYPGKFWGEQYNEDFNIDVTKQWDHFIKWENPVRWP